MATQLTMLGTKPLHLHFMGDLPHLTVYNIIMQTIL